MERYRPRLIPAEKLTDATEQAMRDWTPTSIEGLTGPETGKFGAALLEQTRAFLAGRSDAMDATVTGNESGKAAWSPG